MPTPKPVCLCPCTPPYPCTCLCPPPCLCTYPPTCFYTYPCIIHITMPTPIPMYHTYTSAYAITCLRFNITYPIHYINTHVYILCEYRVGRIPLVLNSKALSPLLGDPSSISSKPFPGGRWSWQGWSHALPWWWWWWSSETRSSRASGTAE